MLLEENIDIEAVKGEIKSLVFNHNDYSLELHLSDSTQLVDSAEVIIQGLSPGKYELCYVGNSKSLVVSDDLKIEVPMSAAGQVIIKRI